MYTFSLDLIGSMSGYKQTLEQKIMKTITDLCIADFIVDEVKNIFEHLTTYKLENILTNNDLFTSFIKEIDILNTNMYTHNRERKKRKRTNQMKLPKPLSYYISTNGRKRLSINEQKRFLKMNKEEIVQKSILIRGWFLLSLSDFAQGSLCRLQNKYLYHVDAPHYNTFTISKK